MAFDLRSRSRRTAFETAAHRKGANVTYLEPTGSQIGRRHTIKAVLVATLGG
jgi:ornithine carbamoyltransferase